MDISLIKKLRQQKNITLEQLAKKTGLSKGYLSRIENASSMPPFPTMQKIANALGKELTEFIKHKDKKQATGNLDLIIAGEDDDLVESISGYSYQKMVSTYDNKYMSPLLMKIEPGRTGELKHDGEEFVFVVKGTAVLEYEGKSYTLPERSGAYLDSRLRHVFVNNDSQPLILLAVNYNYRRF